MEFIVHATLKEVYCMGHAEGATPSRTVVCGWVVARIVTIPNDFSGVQETATIKDLHLLI